MRLPDFIVIGAAKSGTTSLYHYLQQHPAIFMTPVNEANFFAIDQFPLDDHFKGPGDRTTLDDYCIHTLEAYAAQFAAAQPSQLCGGASPLYLPSEHAARRIQHHVPQAKLIAVLRNPVERAFSNYRHYRRAGIEPIGTFEAALAAEEERMGAGWGPWPFWSYRGTGYYAAQVKRYQTMFGKDNLLVLLYDDLRRDPQALLQSIFRFLAIDDAINVDTSIRHNRGGVPRFGRIRALIMGDSVAKKAAKRLIPDAIRDRMRDGVMEANTIEPEMLPATRAALAAGYRSDIEQLAMLIDRDLSSWLDTA